MTETFSMSFDPNDEAQMAAFQEFMDALWDEQEREMKTLATELGISEACALDVQYLRTRSRWTQELEDQLIELHHQGTPPNIMDWPS